MTNTQICLVRHGVTNWNYEGRAQGLVDIPLEPEGRAQAAAAAARLAGEPWDAIYSSTLSRAYDTALAITARAGLGQVRRDERLVERNMGLAEGSTPVERQARWPGVPWLGLPGLETDDEMAFRARGVLTEIARRHPGQRLISVGHGGFISAFLRSILPPGATPISKFHQRNTATTLVEFDGTAFRQVSPSDFSHLLVDGVEFTGEKGRVYGGALGPLLGDRFTAGALDRMIYHATAIESAWVGERLVAFLRTFCDSVVFGHVDLLVAAPGYEDLVPRLMERVQNRYPDILFSSPSPAQERTGD